MLLAIASGRRTGGRSPLGSALSIARAAYRYYSGFDPARARYGVMTVLTRRCLEWATPVVERHDRILETTARAMSARP
jgi:hypothetical protein